MARNPEVSPMRARDSKTGAVGNVAVSAVRLVGAVSPFVWLAVALALVAPWWLRYAGWAMGHCGVVTFLPRP
jgi:hypothetical protein